MHKNSVVRGVRYSSVAVKQVFARILAGCEPAVGEIFVNNHRSMFISDIPSSFRSDQNLLTNERFTCICICPKNVVNYLLDMINFMLNFKIHCNS